jgi:hypothetical protein
MNTATKLGAFAPGLVAVAIEASDLPLVRSGFTPLTDPAGRSNVAAR